MIDVAPIADAELLIWRDQYRAETAGQIVHDSLHRRPGWTVSYALRCASRTIGYGSVAVAGPWQDCPSVYEFFIGAPDRTLAASAFQALVAASGVGHFEVQSNDLLLSSLVLARGRDIACDRIVFEDAVTTALDGGGAHLRQTSDADAGSRAMSQRQGGPECVLEYQGAVIGTGGILFHYNPPYGDVFMEIAEPHRRRGFGAYLVQELKRLARDMGAVPAARCNPANHASIATLQKAGFVPCGTILVGRLG